MMLGSWTLQLLQSGTLICTAVLISNSYALTTAHCVPNGTSVSQLSIIAGTNSLYNPDGSGQQREIIEYYIHPNFDMERLTNDIAVLYFSPLNVSSTVKFLCLPSAGVDPYTVGSNAVVVGWGVTNENNSASVIHLRIFCKLQYKLTVIGISGLSKWTNQRCQCTTMCWSSEWWER